jgi:beta-glucanase (GH16 family)
MHSRTPRIGQLVLLSLATFLLFISAMRNSAAQSLATPQTNAKWTQVWSDEFNGPNGGPPDPSKWTIVTGGDGFGNNELEFYTDRSVNVQQSQGNLVITARKEEFSGPNGKLRPYTSARLQTRGHFERAYGRMEARIRIPQGQGIWPAFWMMGDNFDSVGWPACGEIDIMENVGFEPNMVHGTLHGPGFSGGEALGASFKLAGSQRFADDFHLFATEWEPGQIRFYVDGKLFETRKATELGAGQRWVFDHPFFLLVNLAVGGYWPGEPDVTSRFPATMLIDYVRVYSRTSRTERGRAH